MTRRAQFEARQKRYLARRKLMYDRGWKTHYVMSVSLPHRIVKTTDGRRTPLWNGAKQRPLALVKSAGHGAELPELAFFGFTYITTPAGPRRPPHVAFTGFAGTYFGPPGTKRQKYALIGYHRRRVKWVGRKPDRMNGFQRSCWGAAWLAYSEGVFPDWDPLHRHPNQSDIDGGAAFYSGPFPMTP